MKRRHTLYRAKRSFPKSPAAPASAATDRLLQDAVAHHSAGRLPQAENLYRQLLQLSPHDRDGLHLLGLLALQMGKYAMALELIDQAILVNPEYAEAYSDRGNALQQLQRYQAAVESFDQAILLKPDLPAAYSNRGNALLQLEQYQAAVESYDQAILLMPDLAEAWSNRGSALQELEQFEAALASCDHAILLKPDLAEAWSNRGNALYELEQFEAALESSAQAILLKPGDAPAWNSRGNALHGLKQYQAALESYDEAILLKPNDAQSWSNRSNVLHALQQYQTALKSLDQALQLKPDYAKAWSNRGKALHALQQYQAALKSYDQALLLKPDYAKAWTNRGTVLQALEQYEAALQSFDRAIRFKPECAEAWNNRGNTLVLLQQYHAALKSFDQAILLKPDTEYVRGIRLHTRQLVCDWEDFENQCRDLEARLERGEKVAPPFVALALNISPALQKRTAEMFVRDNFRRPSPNAPIPRRPKRKRIRIGYFSAIYYNHATCYLIAELFERHDRSKFEILGFSFGANANDGMRARVSAAMDQFMDVRSISDQGVAQMSRDLGVDIAVDLMGLTKDHRAGIFVDRAAPIQVNYLGYPLTMGGSFMDYLVADRTLIPEENQPHYSEKIVYLPDSYQVNDSSRLISPKPCTRLEMGLPEGEMVYCCFNNNWKIMPHTFDIWMRILGKVEGSVLWMLEDNAWVGNNLRRQAEQRGIRPERLIFAKRLPVAEHLARHSLADLFLDTLPYNAHTTASDALWAGLPVLTRKGEGFASRVAASLLYAIGLPELVTTTEDAYERLAVDLGLDAERRHAITMRLRQNRLTTPLFDISATTYHLEAAYSAIYERHQADLPPDHIHIPRLAHSSGL